MWLRDFAGADGASAYFVPKNATGNGRGCFGIVWDGPTVHLSDAQVADVVNYVRSHFN